MKKSSSEQDNRFTTNDLHDLSNAQFYNERELDIIYGNALNISINEFDALYNKADRRGDIYTKRLLLDNADVSMEGVNFGVADENQEKANSNDSEFLKYMELLKEMVNSAKKKLPCMMA